VAHVTHRIPVRYDRPGGVSCSRWACTGWADNYLGQAALDARQRFQLSYWEAAIIEASRAMGFTQVLSEDLNDGPDYGDVQVTNRSAEKTEQPVSLSFARWSMTALRLAYGK
jgi:hypothetical protein